MKTNKTKAKALFIISESVLHGPGLFEINWKPDPKPELKEK